MKSCFEEVHRELYRGRLQFAPRDFDVVVDADSYIENAVQESGRPKSLPFLKWPGGKRWFVAKYSHLLPRNYRRYIEPFLGAGSVFFHLQPCRALLGDLNGDLIAVYEGIKIDPEGVERELHAHQREHSSHHYYRVRDMESPEEATERAARIIYLNRTCFNGIYRVNKSGRFNVPVGSRSSVVLDTDDFVAVSRLLKSAELRSGDFEPLVDEAGQDDLVFLDPPYTVRHNNNGFIKYNERLFSWMDQERLALAAIRAVDRGAQLIVTNAAHPNIRELYPSEMFSFYEVSRFSSISAASQNRKQYEELVIVGKGRKDCG